MGITLRADQRVVPRATELLLIDSLNRFRARHAVAVATLGNTTTKFFQTNPLIVTSMY